MMKYLLFLLPISLIAQCDLTNQNACLSIQNSLGLVSPNPTLATWLANDASSNTVMYQTANQLGIKKINLSAQNSFCNGAYLSNSVAGFGSKMITYSNMMKTYAGVVNQDCNIWWVVASSAVEYSPTSIVITSDCNGGGTFAYLAGVPAGTGSNTRCQALDYYDHLIESMNTAGMTLRLGFTPLAGSATNGLGSGGCALTAGSITVEQWESCLGPAITALLTRWNPHITISRVQVNEEFTGIWLGIQTWSVANGSTLINYFSGLVKAVNSNIKVAAAYLGESFMFSNSVCGNHTDLCYWQAAALLTSLDILVIDLFNAQCDNSSNQYATQWSWTYTNMISASSGKEVDIGQWQPPSYCTIGGNPDQANALVGCGSIVWQMSQVQTANEDVCVKLASAYGIKDFSVFFTTPLIGGYAALGQPNNCSSGTYVESVASNLVSTDAASLWNTLQIGWNLSVSGVSFNGSFGTIQ